MIDSFKLKSIAFTCRSAGCFDTDEWTYSGEQEVTINFQHDFVRQAFFYREHRSGEHSAFYVKKKLTTEQMGRLARLVGNIELGDEVESDEYEGSEEAWYVNLYFNDGSDLETSLKLGIPEGGRMLEKTLNKMIKLTYPIMLFEGYLPTETAQEWLRENYLKYVEIPADLSVVYLNPFSRSVQEKGIMLACADLFSDFLENDILLFNGFDNLERNFDILYYFVMDLVSIGGIDPYEWSYSHGVRYGEKESGFSFGFDDKGYSAVAVLGIIREILDFLVTCGILTKAQPEGLIAGVLRGYKQYQIGHGQSPVELEQQPELSDVNVVSLYKAMK